MADGDQGRFSAQGREQRGEDAAHTGDSNATSKPPRAPARSRQTLGHRIAGLQDLGAEVFGVCAAERVGFNGNNMGCAHGHRDLDEREPHRTAPVDQNARPATPVPER